MTTIDFFLWVSHGTTATAINRMVDKYHSKLGRFVYYSEHGECLAKYSLDSIHLNTIKKKQIVEVLPNGYTSSISGNIKNMYKGKSSINNPGYLTGFLVPPIFYSLEHNINDVTYPYMGLYYFAIDPATFEFLKYQKLLDVADLINMYGNKYISLSQIEAHVINACKYLNITNINNVNLGLYACQTGLLQYEKDYQPQQQHRDINDDLESLHNKAELIPSSYINERHISYFSLATTLVDNNLMSQRLSTQQWNALATMTHQGCALNVLSYYGIISQPRARERVVCLTLKGTSIFSIVNYIHNYYTYTGKFAITRLTLANGLKVLYDFIAQNLQPHPSSCVIIFKIYAKNKIPNKEEYSDVGHTVSVCFDFNTKSVWFIDPQIQLKIQLTNDPNQLGIIMSHNYPNMNFIDLIMCGDYTNTFVGPVITFNEMVDLIQQNILTIRDVPQNLFYGGKKSSIKTKRSIHSRISKKYRK